jgi:hypothetical protein
MFVGVFRVDNSNASATGVPPIVMHIKDVHQVCRDSGRRARSTSDSWDTDFSDDEEASKVR